MARGTNVLAVGRGTQLSVIAFRRAGVQNAYVLGVRQSELVSSGVWFQSDNPSVALVRSQEIVGRSAGATNVRALYHGREYPIPFVVVAPNAAAGQFARTWTGTGARYCDDLVGNTRSCYPRVVSNMNVTLTLVNEGGILSGSIQLGGMGWTSLGGPVSAGVNADGDLVVGGFAGSDEHGLHQQLRDWRFTLSGSELKGSGVMDAAFVNIYGPVLHRTTFTTITLR